MTTPECPASPRHELATAVFQSVYQFRAQRTRRWLAALILALKHILRGLLFSWPLYLLVYAGFHVCGCAHPCLTEKHGK